MNTPLSPIPSLQQQPAEAGLTQPASAVAAAYTDPFYTVLDELVVNFIHAALESDRCSGCGGPTVRFYGCGC